MKPVPYKVSPDGRYASCRSHGAFRRDAGWSPGCRRKSGASACPRRPLRSRPALAGHRGDRRHERQAILATLAVEFTLTDPQGQVSPVSGVRQAQNATAAFAWTPVVNDPPGAWTLTARAMETITGKFKATGRARALGEFHSRSPSLPLRLASLATRHSRLATRHLRLKPCPSPRQPAPSASSAGR